MKQYMNKAFTLVELLIVIGIIGLLAVTLLLTLNPSEAQKKTRDTKRTKDAQNIQAILEQYLNDGNTAPAAWSTTVVADASTGTTSNSAGTNIQSQPCATNWLGINLCSYTSTVPTDPSNATLRTCVDNSTGTKTLSNCRMFYYIQVNGSDYEIGVRQESTGNVTKVANDGGNGDRWFEIFSGPQVVGNI